MPSINRSFIPTFLRPIIINNATNISINGTAKCKLPKRNMAIVCRIRPIMPYSKIIMTANAIKSNPNISYISGCISFFSVVALLLVTFFLLLTAIKFTFFCNPFYICSESSHVELEYFKKRIFHRNWEKILYHLFFPQSIYDELVQLIFHNNRNNHWATFCFLE